jgi:GT2 family glycosyltransferase
MVIKQDTLVKLIEHDKPIVSARAHRRVKPFDPCFYIKGEPYHDYPYGLIEVDSVGMACCLIKREVFESIDQPWFYPLENKGEDFSFCKRAKDKGYPIFVDTNIEAGHIGTVVYGERHYKAVKR